MTRMTLTAKANLDMVEITLGSMGARVPYQSAFEIAQGMKVTARMVAIRDRAPAAFDRGIKGPDLKDVPKTHRGFRRSTLVPNFKHWELRLTSDQLVGIVFDSTMTEICYEDAIHLAGVIRLEARRAKAWAGDGGRSMRMVGGIQDGEKLYKLGLN